MTSVALSAVLFVVSFVVLMILVMKGVNLIPAATIGNLIASKALGTTMYDGALIGVVMCAVQVVLVLLNIKRGVHKRLAAAITNGCVQCSVPLLSVCAIVGLIIAMIMG